MNSKYMGRITVHIFSAYLSTFTKKFLYGNWVSLFHDNSCKLVLSTFHKDLRSIAGMETIDEQILCKSGANLVSLMVKT